MNETTLITKVIGILMMSRTYAHLAHLKTPSYSQHVALDDFYTDVVDITDRFAEVAQGKYGKLDIPFEDMKGDVDNPIEGLTSHQTMINNLAKKCENKALLAIIDEINMLYYSTLYKLKELE